MFRKFIMSAVFITCLLYITCILPLYNDTAGHCWQLICLIRVISVAIKNVAPTFRSDEDKLRRKEKALQELKDYLPSKLRIE